MQRIRMCVSIFAGSCLVLTCIGQARAQPATVPPVTPPGASAYTVTPPNDFGYNVRFTTKEGALNVSSKIPSLLAKYKSTEDESERSKIAKELTVVAGEEFDARQAARDKEIAKLELQVKRLRESQARRANEKEEIVKDHVRLLLRNASGLGWSSDGEQPGTVGANSSQVYLDLLPEKGETPMQKK